MSTGNGWSIFIPIPSARARNNSIFNQKISRWKIWIYAPLSSMLIWIIKTSEKQSSSGVIYTKVMVERVLPIQAALRNRQSYFVRKTLYSITNEAIVLVFLSMAEY